MTSNTVSNNSQEAPQNQTVGVQISGGETDDIIFIPVERIEKSPSGRPVLFLTTEQILNMIDKLNRKIH